RTPDLRERHDETKIRSIRRRAPSRTAPNSSPRRPTATEKATAHPIVSVREPRLTDCPLMSTLGHKRTLKRFRPMSALPPKADIRWRSCDVRFVPKADIMQCSNPWGFSHASGRTVGLNLVESQEIACTPNV